MNMIKRLYNWGKNKFTGVDQTADVFLPTDDEGTTQSLGWVRTTTNKLIDLGATAKNVASGLVTGVVDAAKGAGNTVMDGFRAVKQKATDIVEKVENNVAAKAVSNALQQFKTWVSEHKGLFAAAAAALVAVLALIFLPIITALGGLFSSKATEISTSDSNEESQIRNLDSSNVLEAALPSFAGDSFQDAEGLQALAIVSATEAASIAAQVQNDHAIAQAIDEEPDQLQANAGQAASLNPAPAAPAAPAPAVAKHRGFLFSEGRHEHGVGHGRGRVVGFRHGVGGI